LPAAPGRPMTDDPAPPCGPHRKRRQVPHAHMRIRAVVDLLKFVPGMRAVANFPGFRRLKNDLGAVIDTFDIKRLPDRLYFVETIVPNVAKFGTCKLLFVGCRSYSEDYCKLWTDMGIDCWTMDIDPVAARWGMPGHHVIGDMLEADKYFAPASFDAVIMNGLFGFGIETVEQIERALRAGSILVPAGGLLVVGWNTDKTIDTAMLPFMIEHFESAAPAHFPKRKTFASSTHVYDFYIKTA